MAGAPGSGASGGDASRDKAVIFSLKRRKKQKVEKKCDER
jgi:hypothetical protein